MHKASTDWTPELGHCQVTSRRLPWLDTKTRLHSIQHPEDYRARNQTANGGWAIWGYQSSVENYTSGWVKWSDQQMSPTICAICFACSHTQGHLYTVTLICHLIPGVLNKSLMLISLRKALFEWNCSILCPVSWLFVLQLPLRIVGLFWHWSYLWVSFDLVFCILWSHSWGVVKLATELLERLNLVMRPWHSWTDVGIRRSSSRTSALV